MRFFSLAAAASVALLAWMQGAAANTVTETVDFSATNFTNSTNPAGPAAPVDPVTGSITFTLDPTQTYTNESAGITLNNLNMPFAGGIVFDYDPVNGFIIGGTDGGADTITLNKADFFLTFIMESGPKFASFGFFEPSPFGLWNTRDVTLTFTPPLPADAPIPASVVMLLTALGALGGVGYLRSRKATSPMSMLAS